MYALDGDEKRNPGHQPQLLVAAAEATLKAGQIKVTCT